MKNLEQLTDAGDKKIPHAEELTLRKQDIFPDGSDISKYKNYDKVTYQQWAWEFLRRNDDFIKACSTISENSSESDKQAIADQFGLKRYKPWHERYRTNGKPVFAAGVISSWSNIDIDNGNRHLKRLTLKSGQLLIKFDVASAINDPVLLDRQLEKAKLRLEKRLEAYRKACGSESVIPRTRSCNKLLDALRLLDYKATGKSNYECELLINPRRAAMADNKLNNDPPEPKRLGDSGGAKVKKAKEYANKLYKLLAVRKGKP